MGVSRSELYARALVGLVEKHREDLITEQLNQIYGPDLEASGLEPEISSLQSRSLTKDKW